MPAPGANVVMYTLYECRKGCDSVKDPFHNVGLGFGVKDIPIAARLLEPVLTNSLPSLYEADTSLPNVWRII